jgi:hypothetical protein
MGGDVELALSEVLFEGRRDDTVQVDPPRGAVRLR